MKLALAVSFLAAIVAVIFVVGDVTRTIHGGVASSARRSRPRIVLLAVTACALVSILYYHGVTVPEELAAYESASGHASDSLRQAAQMELRRDLLLPLTAGTLFLISLLLTKRGERQKRV